MTETDDLPHHVGHRDRLRARFREAGSEALADYELLELLLFRSQPRRDVKPIAKALLARFGSLAAVIAAPGSRLAEVKGVGESIVTDLKLIKAAAECMTREQIRQNPVFSSNAAVLDYCRAHMAFAEREEFRILFLDRKNTLIADERQQTGTVDHTPVYPREIVKRALELAASAIILIHNHPSGDPTPSRQDIEMTKMIIECAKPFDIVVHDHIIIGRYGATFLKRTGAI